MVFPSKLCVGKLKCAKFLMEFFTVTTSYGKVSGLWWTYAARWYFLYTKSSLKKISGCMRTVCQVLKYRWIFISNSFSALSKHKKEVLEGFPKDPFI